MVPYFTQCDYDKVKEIHAVLYEIAQELKTLFKLEEKEMKSQQEYADRLWVFAQRYRVLEKGAPGVSLYPDFAVARINYEMMEESNTLVAKIRKSNNKIISYINDVAPLYKALEKIVREIDWKAYSGVIRGDEIFKPLVHYVETVADLRRAFIKNVSERKILGAVLDYRFCVTIEAYKDAARKLTLCRNCFSRMISFSELIYPKL